MSKTKLTEEEIQFFINEVCNSAKYKDMKLPAETVRDLIEQELPRHKQVKAALNNVRKKLHQVVAPYLGDPDYTQTTIDFSEAFSDGKNAVEAACLKILASHASTKERLPNLPEFYEKLFSITGVPNTILDLACGLHPFAIPWMNLPRSTNYYAFDLHYPRVELINTFFKLDNRPQLAFYQDILVSPPQIAADVAFFFKEAHRFDQRLKGSNRQFWKSLAVKYLLVSLPSSSLSGKHDKIDQHKRLVYETIKDLNWPVTEIFFENELVFCIQKQL
jgi:16S rRNA (guanine(1405)-N(7))-methyltransferase